jgi:hypothetical protein
MAAEYRVVISSRTPAISSAPTITEIGEVVVWKKIGWQTQLVGDGFMTFSLDPDALSDTIATRFRDIYTNPCEVTLYRDGVVVQRGPVIGIQSQSGTVTVTARGLLYYLRYWYVTTDLEYLAVDQYTIVQGLIDHWQDLDYGDYGIDATGLGSAGQNRIRRYYRVELTNIYKAIQDLSAAVNGFDFWIDSDRVFQVAAFRGTDLSASVFLDSRGLVLPNIFLSAVKQDVANHAIAVGSGVDAADALYSNKNDVTGQSNFGRAGAAIIVEGGPDQAELDDHADALLDATNQLYLVPNEKAGYPILGAGPADFEVGDKVTWQFDFGMGLFTEARWVMEKSVSVDEQGEELMKVIFW